MIIKLCFGLGSRKSMGIDVMTSIGNLRVLNTSWLMLCAYGNLNRTMDYYVCKHSFDKGQHGWSRYPL